ncbi:hypothetical protein MSAS_51390 [Mycobacterium saskatchewanense]|nr:hypothetical protein MSAS_51390 [Mycobacterium saskatchewanense]
MNSRASPKGTVVEWLADGEGLIAWLEQSQLLDSQTSELIRTIARPGELDNIAAQARELREWFRAFVEKYRGAALPRAALGDLAPLNALLERDDSYRLVAMRSQTPPESPAHVEDSDGVAFERILMRRWDSPASLLLPLADAVADAVCSADFSHIKRCAGPACTLVFLDKTKTRARRWCSMAVCGNRAKQSAYREKLKQS